MNQIANQLLKLGPGQVYSQVFRLPLDRRDEWQIDGSLRATGELYLGFLCSFSQALQCHRIFAQVNPLVTLKFVRQKINNLLIEVIATQVGVPVGGFDLEYAATQLKDRYVISAAAQVIYGNDAIFILFTQAVGECCGRRLIDDTPDS